MGTTLSLRSEPYGRRAVWALERTTNFLVFMQGHCRPSHMPRSRSSNKKSFVKFRHEKRSARFIAFLSVDTRRVESSRARKMSSHMLPTRAVSAIRAAVVTRSAYVKIPTAMEGYEYAALMRAIEVVKTKPLLRGCSLSKLTSCASHLCPFCSSSHEVPTDERSIAHSRCP